MSATTFLVVHLFAAAQQLPGNTLGVFAGLHHSWNYTSLPILYGDPSCGEFRNGTAVDWFAGVEWGQVFGNFPLILTLRARYQKLRANLDATQQRYQVYNPQTGQYEDLLLHYEYQSVIHYILAGVGLRYYLPWLSGFALHCEFEAGNALIGSAFEEYEEIVLPKGAYFPDNTRRHQIAGGAVPDLTTNYGVNVRISWEKSILPNTAFVLESGYRYGLNSLLTTSDWTVRHFEVSGGIRYTFPVKTEAQPVKKRKLPPSQELQKEEIPQRQPQVVIHKIVPKPLKLIRTVVTQTYPLLPYIFFDSASAVLSDRYRWMPENPETFTEDSLPKDMLQIYYALLPIVGKRMQRNADAKLRIIGIARDDETSSLQQQQALARERANAVARYFVEQWGISPNRLRAEWQTVPTFPTSEIYPEGREENRRVELQSDDPALLKPVVHTQFDEFRAESAQLPVEFDLSNGDRIRKLRLSLQLHGQEFVAMEVPSVGENIVYLRLPEKLIQEGGKTPDALILSAEILTTDTVLQYQTAVPVFRIDDTVEVSRLSLVVFPFDRYDLTEENRQLLHHFVAQALTPHSRVRIIGSADILGDPEYNLWLSQRRAEEVARYLSTLFPAITFEEVKGIGATQLRYDNTLPEGRYYSRTVLVEIINPVR